MVNTPAESLLNETFGHIWRGFMILRQAKSCRIIKLGKVLLGRDAGQKLVHCKIANPMFACSKPGWKVTYGC
jgi:hypothetical protein